MVSHAANLSLVVKTLNRDKVEAETGYRPFTTFYEDFGIAERFGIPAVRETYGRVLKEWGRDHKYLTELVMVLNWKIWEHHEHNESLALLYEELWEKARDYAYDTLTGSDLEYFFQVTE